MNSQYFAVGILFLLGLTIGGLFLVLSALIGRGKKTKAKLMPYECGVDQASSPRRGQTIRFFLVAMLFLLFDVEVAFLFPWAALVQEFKAAGLGTFILVEGLVFLGVLVFGLAYVWKRGALDWERTA